MTLIRPWLFIVFTGAMAAFLAITTGCSQEMEPVLGETPAEAQDAPPEPVDFWPEEPEGAGPRALQNWVDSGTEIALFRVWHHKDETPELALVHPNGEVLTAKDFAQHQIKVKTADDKWFSKVEGKMVPQSPTSIELSQPAIGLWQLRIDGSSEYDSKKNPVEILNRVENQLQVAKRLAYSPESGVTRVLEAALTPFPGEPKPPLTDIHVRAACYPDEEGSTQEGSTKEESTKVSAPFLTFRDDGRGWDRQADDGIFTHDGVGISEPPADPDSWSQCLLRVSIVGKVNGHGFFRHGIGEARHLFCQNPNLQPGQTYDLLFSGQSAYRFLVQEITAKGEVLVREINPQGGGRSQGTERVPLNLAETLCSGFEIRPYKE